MTTYQICDANGDALVDGLSADEAQRIGRVKAYERGESVWVSESDSAEMGNEITPAVDVKITTRARAFSGHGLETVRCLVEPDDDILVWSTLAGHYTRRHSLAPSAVRRIVRLARERRAELGRQAQDA